MKKALISALVMQAPDWSLPIELMCDSSDFFVGAILGKRKEGKPYVIYYIRRQLIPHNGITRQQRMKCLYSGFCV